MQRIQRSGLVTARHLRIQGGDRLELLRAFATTATLGVILLGFLGLVYLAQPTPGTIYRQADWQYEWMMQVDGAGEVYEIYKRCTGWRLWCFWELDGRQTTWDDARRLMDSREAGYRRQRLLEQRHPVYRQE